MRWMRQASKREIKKKKPVKSRRNQPINANGSLFSPRHPSRPSPSSTPASFHARKRVAALLPRHSSAAAAILCCDSSALAASARQKPPPPRAPPAAPKPPFFYPATTHPRPKAQMRRRGKKQEGMKEKGTEVEPQKRRCSFTSSSSLSAQAPLVAALEPCFQSLPHDVIVRIAGAFTVPNLWAASLVCRAWRDVLRPLREAMALVRWGKRFKHGHGGVSANVEKALDSFLKGAARGCTPAMVDAGLVYWEMGDKVKAIAWYRKAAELGDPAGQCNLGISYLQADPPRQVEAVKWFHKAALAGHVRAQYNLALSLHQGRGIERDPPEAAKWYLKAAEGGNPRAMYNTSLCYSSGEGVPVSIRQAKKWMKRAADTGHSKAQYEYGLSLFSMGDMVNALVYLELATRAGESAANYVKNVLLQQLPAATRDRAMQTANTWEPTIVSR